MPLYHALTFYVICNYGHMLIKNHMHKTINFFDLFIDFLVRQSR